MSALALGRRLGAVVAQVEGDTLADIGCDHGKVSLACLSENRVKKVIACDISAKSLQKAVDLATKIGADNITFRVGDGLQVVGDDEADCVVIAGMGGNEIMSILSHIPKGVKKLVLSPHRNTVELREFLSKRDIYIAKDFVVKDGGKFYDIIVAEVDSGRDCSLTKKQLLLGKKYDGEEFEDYISSIRQKSDVLSQKGALSKQARQYKEILDIVGNN